MDNMTEYGATCLIAANATFSIIAMGFLVYLLYFILAYEATSKIWQENLEKLISPFNIALVTMFNVRTSMRLTLKLVKTIYESIHRVGCGRNFRHDF
ncbi:hypothetical protein HK100_012026 [Physocladia obscura]|uniref:Uncharacterized protein n=1 Tax=Physocladia obscura TaxID=109957 RepID=A0AAD5T6E0_9FUNG|nr:hypothetical protein HK100_012026 [Physocladia obscura]